MMADEVVFDGSPEEIGPERLMALWREGKIPKERLDRKARAGIAREMASKRRTHGGGRPRTIPHKPGPRGGCRCAECRGKRKA